VSSKKYLSIVIFRVFSNLLDFGDQSNFVSLDNLTDEVIFVDEDLSFVNYLFIIAGSDTESWSLRPGLKRHKQISSWW
jgi:hypothetical protein